MEKHVILCLTHGKTCDMIIITHGKTCVNIKSKRK